MGFVQKVGSFAPKTMLKRKLSKTAPSMPSKSPRVSEEHCQTSTAASRFFSDSLITSNFSQKFINIQLELNDALKSLKFKPPVAYVYNPVEYAFKGNETYVKKYCHGPKKVLFVGMNPGPFGMCQTGVPFGEVTAVREWLQIEEDVDKPEKECPERPIQGFDCPKSEVSGLRLWNVFKKLSGSPDVFFKNCFVFNYCPIAMMNDSGGNLTPTDIKDVDTTKALEEICDQYYFQVIQLLKPEIIIGIGRYAEKRTLLTLKNCNSSPKVLFLTHPSPRVVNNQNWTEKAEKFFESQNLLQYLTA